MAANAPELQEDFGWRSNHVVTLIAKSITTSYYGKPIAHSYMAGGSKGGQAVLMEAQRFSEDCDGLLPSAAVYDYTGRNTIAAAWFAQGVSDGHGGSVIDVAVVRAVHASVLELCGAQAGVEEGLVTDPPSCKWHPEMIACHAGSAGANCLSVKQVAAIRRLMSPATDAKGEVLWAYPYVPGTEIQWRLELSGHRRRGTGRAFRELRPTGSVSRVFRRRNDSSERRRPSLRSTTRRRSICAHSKHGAARWLCGMVGRADGAISATASIGYYEGVAKQMGGRERTRDFFRLFLIPGVDHFGGGPGLSEFDTLTALEEWLEMGKAPEKLIASRSTDNVTERTRLVFPYPILAHYSGKGSPLRAESFVPSDPSGH